MESRKLWNLQPRCQSWPFRNSQTKAMTNWKCFSPRRQQSPSTSHCLLKVIWKSSKKTTTGMTEDHSADISPEVQQRNPSWAHQVAASHFPYICLKHKPDLDTGSSLQYLGNTFVDPDKEDVKSSSSDYGIPKQHVFFRCISPWNIIPEKLCTHFCYDAVVF